MSRHTRRLRKQARAQAAARGATHPVPHQPAQTGFGSGATAVLDRPASHSRRHSPGPCLDELAPDELDANELAVSELVVAELATSELAVAELEMDERWAGRDVDEGAGAVEVQARDAGSRDDRPRQPVSAAGGRAAGGPVVPVAKASRSEGTAAPRRVIPGREPVGETPPGERRQPYNDGWLWRDKICVGDLVVIVGEEGAGKTRLLTDWMARVTTGRPFPGSDDPSDALPPSDVLVFNCVDDFRRDILDQVTLNGGDPQRVLHASTQLLDWGHTHSEFPEGPFATPGRSAGEPPETRVRLHTQEMLRKLRQFLLRRPSIRLVVIDQLKQHLKTDSERVFEDLIDELQVVGRQTEVTFVLTQRPDAFRNATGIRQYFKSESLTSVARGIWRVAQPEDPTQGDRVLECLKLNHGYGDSGREPWRLWQAPGQPLRWELGNGQEFPLSKLDAKQRLLFHAKTFISLYLRMFGGLADFETLRICARREGITGSKLMEASIVYNFGYEFEACPDSDLGIRKIIGAWEEIVKRREIPEPDRPPVVGPPLPKRRKKPAPLGPTPLADYPAANHPATNHPATNHPTTRFPAAETTAVAVPTAGETAAPAVAAGGGPASAAEEATGSVAVARPRPPLTEAERLESLRARVARGEARLREFDLEGFRFIKPNLATCHLLLNLEADLGSEALVLEQFEQGWKEMGRHSPADLRTHLEEVRRLFRIAHQIDAV